jgi:hypothetical protein
MARAGPAGQVLTEFAFGEHRRLERLPAQRGAATRVSALPKRRRPELVFGSIASRRTEILPVGQSSIPYAMRRSVCRYAFVVAFGGRGVVGPDRGVGDFCCGAKGLRVDARTYLGARSLWCFGNVMVDGVFLADGAAASVFGG